MQTESNAYLSVGLPVYYIASEQLGRRIYAAAVKRVLAHDRCDLRVQGNVDGKHPTCLMDLYQVRYDSEGEPHSWHKKSDQIREGD